MSDVAAELGADWHAVNNAVLAGGQALLDADVARVGQAGALGVDEVLFAPSSVPGGPKPGRPRSSMSPPASSSMWSQAAPRRGSVGGSTPWAHCGVMDLLGRAGPVRAVDIFEQLEGPTVDLLWVIDNSCSMYDEQARLVSNLSRFASYAESQNASYQMGVTVTDSRSDNAGKFERCWPHPAIISSDYANLATREEAFECTFLVGTDSISFFEAGLGGAMRALERALSTTIPPETNANRGFIREEAKLAIVTVSDEDDQSSESDRLMRDYFWSVKGFNRRERVRVHTIAGPTRNQCAQGDRFAEPGYRYEWMANQTGGIFFDICQDDWTPVLDQLGLNVFSPLDEWDLSQSADPGTLVVNVDGVAIRPDALNGYTYLPPTNSVRFNGTSVPAPGSQVVIEYSGLCRP